MQTNKKHDLAVFLIQSGADVNALNDLGESPMHLALQYGNLDYVNLLVDNDALLYLESEVRSSLHYAVMGRNLDLIDWAIQQGMDVNLQDPNGNTPLHLAVFIDRGKLKMVDYLVTQKGAHLNIKNNKGQTPVDLAKTTNYKAKQYFEKLATE
jgi:ankyrin repeat protein